MITLWNLDLRSYGKFLSLFDYKAKELNFCMHESSRFYYFTDFNLDLFRYQGLFTDKGSVTLHLFYESTRSYDPISLHTF